MVLYCVMCHSALCGYASDYIRCAYCHGKASKKNKHGIFLSLKSNVLLYRECHEKRKACTILSWLIVADNLLNLKVRTNLRKKSSTFDD